MLLTGGSLADRYGRWRLFTVGLIVFTAGSALCGAAQDPAMLIVSRAVQGMGGSIMFATSLALLAQAFHAHYGTSPTEYRRRQSAPPGGDRHSG